MNVMLRSLDNTQGQWEGMKEFKKRDVIIRPENQNMRELSEKEFH